MVAGGGGWQPPPRAPPNFPPPPLSSSQQLQQQQQQQERYDQQQHYMMMPPPQPPASVQYHQVPPLLQFSAHHHHHHHQQPIVVPLGFSSPLPQNPPHPRAPPQPLMNSNTPSQQHPPLPAASWNYTSIPSPAAPHHQHSVLPPPPLHPRHIAHHPAAHQPGSITQQHHQHQMVYGRVCAPPQASAALHTQQYPSHRAHHRQRAPRPRGGRHERIAKKRENAAAKTTTAVTADTSVAHQVSYDSCDAPATRVEDPTPHQRENMSHSAEGRALGTSGAMEEGSGDGTHSHHEKKKKKKAAGTASRSRSLTATTMYSEEEIARWRADRRRNWPSNENRARKEAETKAMAEKGCVVDSSASGRGGASEKRKAMLREVLLAQRQLGVAHIAGTDRMRLPGVDGDADARRSTKKRKADGSPSKPMDASAAGEGADDGAHALDAHGATAATDEIDATDEVNANAAIDTTHDKSKNTKMKKRQKKQKPQQQRQRQHQMKKRTGIGGKTLLLKLLAKDIRRERSWLLQSVRFVTRNNFFLDADADISNLVFDDVCPHAQPEDDIHAIDDDGDGKDDDDDDDEVEKLASLFDGADKAADAPVKTTL